MLLKFVKEIVDGVESCATGMKTTAQFAKETISGSGPITSNYPAEKPKLPDRFRGHLFNDVDNCITCKLCLKACPVDCFAIEGEMNELNKQRPSHFTIDLTKCIYCGYCVQACPTECLKFTNDFELDPVNTVNKLGQRYLFKQGPEQVSRRLTSSEIQRLHKISGLPQDQLTADDRAFMASVESPQGHAIMGIFGMGFFTTEEKARVQAALEEKKKEDARKKAELAAKAAAAKAAAPATPATPAASTPIAPATPASAVQAPSAQPAASGSAHSASHPAPPVASTEAKSGTSAGEQAA